MNYILPKYSEIKQYTVKQIDEVIAALDSYSNYYVQTNDLKKLHKVIELKGVLIDVRCEKLGIIL